jgi:hypothetical protein
MLLYECLLLSFASNPFSANVIALTPKNFNSVVRDSPHGVFVNVCRAT